MIIHQTSNSKGNFNYNAFIYSDLVWPPHFHGNYELIYTISGNTSVTINGTEYAADEGTFILVSPYSIHSLTIDANTSTWVGVFSEDYVADFSKTNKYTMYSPFQCDKKIEEFLKHYLIREETPDHFMLIACLNAVCGECIKNAEMDCVRMNNEPVEQIIQYVTSNLTRDITLGSTAKALGYEYHYFSSVFKRYFRVNFKRFINILRFEHACTIMGDKSKSVTEVCFESGFDTVRNFNRVFKELSGFTPSEYRKNVL